MVDQDTRLLFDPVAGSAQAWTVNAQGLERERLQGPAQRAAGDRLAGVMMARRGHLAPLEVVHGTSVPSYETFEQLAALGYVDATAAVGSDASGGGGCTGAP